MRIYMAGSDTRNFEKFCRIYKIGKLYSYLNEQKQIESFEPGIPMIVDSGAHSYNKSDINNMGMKASNKKLPAAKEFIKTYVDVAIGDTRENIVYVEFDVYGRLDKSIIDEHYYRAANQGQFLMRVYHPVIDNGQMTELQKWVDEGVPYIGVGRDSIDYLPRIFKVTKDVPVHGFGITTLSILEKYPFYSADSTTALSTVIFGNVPDKGLTTIGKDDIIRDKRVEILMNDWERLEQAVKNSKKVELYLTELWKLKKSKSQS
jgi:hypothetical protein